MLIVAESALAPFAVIVRCISSCIVRSPKLCDHRGHFPAELIAPRMTPRMSCNLTKHERTD